MNYSNRELSPEEFALCSEQAELFKMAAMDQDVSEAYFVRSFMNSSFAKSMDDGSFSHSPLYIDDVFGAIKGRLKKRRKLAKTYTPDVMNWIGYMYRYWSIVEKAASKEIYAVAKIKAMATYFPLYHTQDPEKALQMICETLPAKNDISFAQYYYQNKK